MKAILNYRHIDTSAQTHRAFHFNFTNFSHGSGVNTETIKLPGTDIKELFSFHRLLFIALLHRNLGQCEILQASRSGFAESFPHTTKVRSSVLKWLHISYPKVLAPSIISAPIVGKNIPSRRFPFFPQLRSSAVFRGICVVLSLPTHPKVTPSLLLKAVNYKPHHL